MMRNDDTHKVPGLDMFSLEEDNNIDSIEFSNIKQQENMAALDGVENDNQE